MAGQTVIDNDGVSMSADLQVRIRHASDVVDGKAECFGGDQLGHWNVGRINRILDAMAAPTVWLPIDHQTRYDMARVGKPDPGRAIGYALRGVASMPPLTFVQMPGGDPDEVRSMLVDGHHRMLALVRLQCEVPARILPALLADDCRIVEMSEVAVFPDPQFARLRKTDLGRAPRGVA